MLKKVGFSARVSFVGGSLVVVPMASWGVGGDLGSSERMWLFIERVSGKIYWKLCQRYSVGEVRWSCSYDVRIAFECGDQSPTCQRQRGPYGLSDTPGKHRRFISSTRSVERSC